MPTQGCEYRRRIATVAEWPRYCKTCDRFFGDAHAKAQHAQRKHGGSK